MYHWILRRQTQARLISWLLVAVFGLLALHPVHIHMLHDTGETPSPTQHWAQVHPTAVVDDLEGEPVGPTLEPISQKILKSSGFQILLVALLVGVALLPARSALRIRRPSLQTRPLNSLFRHRVPPLRAPPLV